MWRSLRSLYQLIRAGRLLARYDVLFDKANPPDLPWAVRNGYALARLRFPWEPGSTSGHSSTGRLSAALAALGPSYIKLGQFLATRPDIIGNALASDLGQLRDQLPPFAQEKAVAIIEEELGHPVEHLFPSLGKPVAAASIAQVHKARIASPDGTGKNVAVKILRPDVETLFARDLDTFFWAAAWVERHRTTIRRLRPVAGVQTLADSVAREMDFRLEAAAISEMAENIQDDDGFRVPGVDWHRTTQRVLTLEWVDGIAMSEREALETAGHNLAELAVRLIQNFLKHATRDGFFHADMHQGNLFVEADGTIVAVDFGIMGRLDVRSRQFLAEILYGFVTRNYQRVAEVHFEAGYVPKTKNMADFAQALRAIGEPVFGLNAQNVSMGKLLSQLFTVTGQFDMVMRPELILLQKTMVVVEGVARYLDPDHNIWSASEPVLADWMATRLGPEAVFQEAASNAAAIGKTLGQLPDLIDRAGKLLDAGHNPYPPHNPSGSIPPNNPGERQENGGTGSFSFRKAAFWTLLGAGLTLATVFLTA